MMSARLKLSVVPVVVAVVALAGCSGESAPGAGEAGTLSLNVGPFPDNWAPGAELEAGFMRVPYENLVALDGESGELEPVLATGWEQSDTTLTLSLRTGVTFHDGTPFNAEAVKVNLESVRNAPGPYAGPLQAITSIDSVDDATVRLNLAEPTPSMLTTLSTRVAPMASPAAIRNGTAARQPVGTGPWAYDDEASTAGTTMTFRSYPGYWGGAENTPYQAIKFFGVQDENAAIGALSSGQISITVASRSRSADWRRSPG